MTTSTTRPWSDRTSCSTWLLSTRIEVVRGPSAAVYGNNAFFAVINVIRGVDRASTGARSGSRAEPRTSAALGDVRASARRRRRLRGLGVRLAQPGSDLYFPELDVAGVSDGRPADVNDEHSKSAFFALAYRGSPPRPGRRSAEGGADRSLWHGVGRRRNWTNDRNTVLAAGYEGSAGGWTYGGHATHGRSDYFGSYAYEGDDVYHDGSAGVWWGLGGQATAPERGRHRFTFGGDVQDDVRQDQWWQSALTGERTVDSRARVLAGGASSRTRSGSLLLLQATLGVRYDRHPPSIG